MLLSARSSGATACPRSRRSNVRRCRRCPTMAPACASREARADEGPEHPGPQTWREATVLRSGDSASRATALHQIDPSFRQLFLRRLTAEKDFERERLNPPQEGVGTTRGRSDGTPSDRKSTRLNSSHEWISYAVFCL